MGMTRSSTACVVVGKRELSGAAVSVGTCELNCVLLFFLAKYKKILAKLVELILEKPRSSNF